MNTINDGGPAFAYGNHEQGGASGMSLRDRIAIEALGGMLAHPTRYKPRDAFQHWHAAISEEAYELADAMIASRGQP